MQLSVKPSLYSLFQHLPPAPLYCVIHVLIFALTWLCVCQVKAYRSRGHLKGNADHPCGLPSHLHSEDL